MWAVFLLHDLTALSWGLRRQAPEDERINEPSNPNQIWSYRLPFTVQEAIDDPEFTPKMRALAEETHRV
jgi:4-alpha-glucanotransferase